MRNKIDCIDVKILEKAKLRGGLRRFRRLLAKAEKLDLAYRVQLANKPAYSYRRAA